MYLDGKHEYFIGAVLDISRKATVASAGWGVSTPMV